MSARVIDAVKFAPRFASSRAETGSCMKIAIHQSTGSFSTAWIDFCRNTRIDYRIVDCYRSDIVAQLNDCDALMWHHGQACFKDVLVAKKLLFALEHAGMVVFPDFRTGWHFDDKVAQKYLLEAIRAPLVPSYVFYDEGDASDWAMRASYPIVFKLRGGAASANVRLVNGRTEALRLIRKAFRRGFSQFDRFGYLRERYARFRGGQATAADLLKGIVRALISTQFARQQGRERGYVYFQEFMPDNTFDTRVVVVNGERAAAERRFVRQNDFRASGSGQFSYENISRDAVKLAFAIARELQLQSVAFDFLVDRRGEPLVTEMSYGFGTDGINRAPGYWDSDLNWHEDGVDARRWIIELIAEARARARKRSLE